MNIGIAGAGLMGRLLAWKLGALGYSVSLFDKDMTSRESVAYIAAGMISPYAEIDAHPEIFQWGLRSIVLWKEILNEFEDQSWFQQKGSLTIAHHTDINELDLFIKKIKQKTESPEIRHLTQKNLFEFEPEIHCSQAVYLANEALIDGRKLLNLLLDSNQENKPAKTYNEKIISVKPHQIITHTQASHHFDLVFDCRGVGGCEHFKELRAVRGEIIIVRATDVNISRPIRLLHPHYQLYIAPRAPSLYVIGASEIETDDTSPISVRSCLELLTAAYSIHRGFAEARILELNTGLRPALTNNLPQIKYNDGLIAINGLYRHGYLLAPVLVEKIIHFLKSGDKIC